MMPPNTAREVLIVEALGEAARLIGRVEALAPALEASRQALVAAQSGLVNELAAFEAQVLALTEKAKVGAVKHILARTAEAARQSADLHGRAMADAARVAFGAEIGAALQRLRSPHEGEQRRWEGWLTHAAAAAIGAAVAWTVAILWLGR
jgi:hypothetical protein